MTSHTHSLNAGGPAQESSGPETDRSLSWEEAYRWKMAWKGETFN